MESWKLRFILRTSSYTLRLIVSSDYTIVFLRVNLLDWVRKRVMCWDMDFVVFSRIYVVEFTNYVHKRMVLLDPPTQSRHKISYFSQPCSNITNNTKNQENGAFWSFLIFLSAFNINPLDIIICMWKKLTPPDNFWRDPWVIVPSNF